MIKAFKKIFGKKEKGNTGKAEPKEENKTF